MARFFVVFRMGGAVNGTTRVSLGLDTREQAEQLAADVRRGGRVADVEELTADDADALDGKAA